jgi:hypothetical protein
LKFVLKQVKLKHVAKIFYLETFEIKNISDGITVDGLFEIPVEDEHM